jgi:branched-subunit amino acid ABC-type transport system permease component
MTQLLQLAFFGIAIGSVLALAAVGVSLVYGGLKIINFAHGDYMTLGAYLALGVSSGWHLGLPLGVAAAVIGTALFAVVVELLVWRPLRARRAALLSVFVTAIGLSLVLRQGILFAVGGGYDQFDVNAYSVYRVGALRLPVEEVTALAIAAVAIAALCVMLARTPLGKAIRGLSDNAELTAISGIDPGRLAILVWALAGGLAGLSGVLLGLVESSFDTNLGWDQLLTIFCAVVLGGIGSAYGALLGGLVLGLVLEVASWSGFAGGVPASYQLVVPFVALVVILLVRPSGLLGRSRVL